MYSETLAAAMGLLMRSGPVSPWHFHVLLCVGHTHNPQSRPWVSLLDRFNPWRDKRSSAFRAFERAFSLKTRYLNSGTVGWWEGVVWAIQITPEGVPRLVYWSDEDREPVTMDWELTDEQPLPATPLGETRRVGRAVPADRHRRRDRRTLRAQPRAR